MAVTATLVHASANRLRYLIAHDGETGDAVTIGNTGGATPDLLTDLLTAPDSVGARPLQEIVDAGRNGIAQVAAGALIQAQARAFMNSDDTAGVLVSNLVPRAECSITARTGQSIWEVDVDVDGNANPTVTVTGTAATAADAYLEIERVGGANL